MTEEFLHYIWKFSLFEHLNLHTQSGELIEIVHVGEHNTDSGPDFFNAKIKVGDTLWAGNVEIHINSSDWKKHHHDQDKSYDTVILHVVCNADEQVYRNNGEAFPSLELKNRLNTNIYNNYLRFKSNKDWIPCEKQIQNADKFIVNNWLDRLLIERLEKKSTEIIDNLILNKNNWEETFYHQIAKSFGFKLNAEPFELLAKSIPLQDLEKNKNNLFRLEAIFFGQSGLLDNKFKDQYPNELSEEYRFIEHKLNLKPLPKQIWKFFRLHPVNFPTIRISQFASLIYQSSHLFSKVLEFKNNIDLHNLLCIETSAYWESHFVFDKNSSIYKKKLGSGAINHIIINTVAPFLFVYGKQKKEDKFMDAAIKLLEETEGEKNAIIKKWNSLNIPTETAYSTQALLQLKNEYCAKQECLNCAIGNYLLKQ